MGNLLQQITAAVIIVAVTLAGPAIATFFLLRRKRKRRAARRSPLTKSMLRSPGQSLREQLDEATSDLGFNVMALAVFPVLIVALYLAQKFALGKTSAGLESVWVVYLAIGAALLALQVRRMVSMGHRIDDLRAGYDAELAVGQELDQLMARGARVFHDVPADGFNIDHVLVCGAGVFAIETKGFTKPRNVEGRASARVTFDGSRLHFPTWTTREPLDQAERQARWLGGWISSAIGEPVAAMAALVLPGWFVERTGRSEIRVLSGAQVDSLLSNSRGAGLPAQVIQRVSHQLDQRCRTVLPEYRDDIGKV